MRFARRKTRRIRRGLVAKRGDRENERKMAQADLGADKGKGADNARKMLASISSDYAMEDKATIVEAARKANTLRQIDAQALMETEREIEGLSDTERVFAYYDKNTNQHLYRITDGKDEVWNLKSARL